MSKSPLDQAKSVTRTNAWNRQGPPVAEELPEATKPSTPGKLKTKFADYSDSVVKKTTVELPEEVMTAWTIYCAQNKKKKREHLLELLTKDMNKTIKP